MRPFVVCLPSGVRYWTVLDDDLVVVAEVDAFLRHLRLGRDCSELTTRSYAGGISLFLGWCALTGRHWHIGVEQLGLFITWLRHAGIQGAGAEAFRGEASAVVLAGPGRRPVRGARRVNAVLTAVRGFVVHAVTSGNAPGTLLSLIYELADDRDLPEQARGEDHAMAWRMRARHRLHEPDAGVDRASDGEIVALVAACRSARDRLIVLLMARAGLRRGELCGLRRSDVHLLVDSAVLGCGVSRAHVHVLRRANPNGAWAKSRRSRAVPLDSLLVQAFDAYAFERLEVPEAAESDFVLVNLFRAPLGAPSAPDAINELLTAAGRRAGLHRQITPHQLRHAFGSNLADAGGTLDEIAALLGHKAVSSSQVYLHPDPARLRDAVERVPTPRDQSGAQR
ncbi:MAG TPA: site-specific integrase [Dermatophilaceae bacterium]|nr:site-specific integrase [Dermatophilaceae bacterium]